MSDELRRGFQDKMQGRGAGARRPGAGSNEPAPGAAPVASLSVAGLEFASFRDAAPLNPRFLDLRPRMRLTLAIGPSLAGPLRWLGPLERAALLDLCPGLPRHECGAGPAAVQRLLAEVGAGPARAPEVDEPEDGLPAAHLIEHVALEILATVTGAPRAHGAACAHEGEGARCDVYFECDDGALGRAVALLAAAVIRDLQAGAERSLIHRRCRDLLGFLLRSRRQAVAPEDAAAALRCDRADAREALEALARFGFVEKTGAPLTFSSPAGVLFRRVLS